MSSQPADYSLRQQPEQCRPDQPAGLYLHRQTELLRRIASMPPGIGGAGVVIPGQLLDAYKKQPTPAFPDDIQIEALVGCASLCFQLLIPSLLHLTYRRPFHKRYRRVPQYLRNCGLLILWSSPRLSDLSKYLEFPCVCCRRRGAWQYTFGGQTGQGPTLTFWRSTGLNRLGAIDHFFELFSTSALALHGLREPVAFAVEDHNVGMAD